jgi:NAD(P)H-dependent FMN reductase
MPDLEIAVILGSTRPNRNGKAVADWVMDQTAGRSGARYTLVDLVDYPLPHLDEPIPPSAGRYVGEHTLAWADTIASFDGFVFVTPEYNHSTSGVLKNAIDYLYAEWNNKAAGFVSYGAVSGARAVEHLRGVMSEVQVAHVRQSVGFSLVHDFENFSQFNPNPRAADQLGVMLDQLEAWTAALKGVRENRLPQAA